MTIRIRFYSFISLVSVFLPELAVSQSKQPFCYGEKKEIVVASQMPYVVAAVSGSDGHFLLDFGTTTSTIDPNGFTNSLNPKPKENTSNQFEDFNFFGPWGTVTLNVQNHSNIQGIAPLRQAGIIGTDFLSSNVFTLDYVDEVIYRAEPGSECSDDILTAEGFKPVSTQGFYSNDLAKLNNACTPNIPTVTIQIGNSIASAQLDPGFDDRIFKHSININQAFYNSLISSGVKLLPIPEHTQELSTCINGLKERVLIFKLEESFSAKLIGIDGNPILLAKDVHLCLKQTPLEAKTCGGIGTWQIPAAQVGASILKDSKRLVFDPFKSLVWFYTK